MAAVWQVGAQDNAVYRWFSCARSVAHRVMRQHIRKTRKTSPTPPCPFPALFFYHHPHTMSRTQVTETDASIMANQPTNEQIAQDPLHMDYPPVLYRSSRLPTVPPYFGQLRGRAVWPLHEETTARRHRQLVNRLFGYQEYPHADHYSRDEPETGEYLEAKYQLTHDSHGHTRAAAAQHCPSPRWDGGHTPRSRHPPLQWPRTCPLPSVPRPATVARVLVVSATHP